MGHFQSRASELCCEEVSLRARAAVAGTPAYVYSKAALLESLAGYGRAFHDVPHVVCYSVKANSNLGVLSVLAKAGAGADIVSGGELFRALRAGIPAKKIIFSGVGKSRDELRDALKAEILMFNVESRSELRVLDEVAREMGVRAPVALRVNPDVDPQTHPYIATGLKTSKFGIPYADALQVYEEAAALKGLSVIGAEKFVVTDAAMNDLIRPSLYDAHHEILPVDERRRSAPTEKVDVVGPICESGDFLAKDRELPRTEEDDLVALMSAGAYGFV